MTKQHFEKYGTVAAFEVTDTSAAPEFTFMEVRAEYRGQVENWRFFLGTLPKPGDAVEMVYVGDSGTGGMRFQLRTRAA